MLETNLLVSSVLAPRHFSNIFWKFVSAKKQVDHIMSEKQILAKLQHPFIVNMLGRSNNLHQRSRRKRRALVFFGVRKTSLTPQKTNVP